MPGPVHDRGNAFLADFGIALEAATSSGSEAALSPGSPAYASPEQLQNEALGPEADVFSLGVVLFECLTGALPFVPAASEADLERQLHERAPDAVDPWTTARSSSGTRRISNPWAC